MGQEARWIGSIECAAKPGCGKARCLFEMWPVFVINMAENTRRLARCAAELDAAGIDWIRLEAVDGRALSVTDLAGVYDAETNRRRAKHPLVPPEIGCYLSHIAAWERIAAGDAPGGIVLEDDFRITGDLKTAIERLAANADGWDLTKLFSFKPVTLQGTPRELGQGFLLGTPTRVPSTTLGYAITKAGAQKLADQARPFFRPVDEDHKFFWEYDLNVAMLLPCPIAIGEQDTVSGTVGEVRRKAGRGDDRSMLTRVWLGLKYRVGYMTGLYISRLKGRSR